MKTESQYLYDFIQKESNVVDVCTIKKPLLFHSEKTVVFLKKLIQYTKQGEQEWNKQQQDMIEMKNCADIPKGKHHDWIDTFFQTKIASYTTSICQECQFTINRRLYTIFLVFPSASSSTSPYAMKQKIKRIYIWFYILQYYAMTHCSHKVTIYLYLTDEKKEIPLLKKNPIDKIHANTAFTTSCANETEITIYRQEEWFKVLLHESFHNMGLDFSGMQETITQSTMLQLFHIESEVNLFETYCEIWAETMNVVFYLFFTEKNHDETLIQKIEICLQHEQIFTLIQLVKILHHYELTYDDLLRNTLKNRKYKEKTNVFAYYVLKAIGLCHIDEFIEWNAIHNEYSLNFQKTKKNLHDYCDFFATHHQNSIFINNIHEIETWYSSYILIHKNTYEMKTMRMILHDW